MSKLHSRKDLKKFFRNGGIPTENHFSFLIDSMINRQDDGISKNDDDGLILASSKKSTKLLTLYKTVDDEDPFFFIEKDEQENGGLHFNPAGYGNQSQPEKKSFFFHENGSLGVGKRSNKDYSIDINGFAAMEGRVGTFLQGKVLANGRWQTIIGELDNCQAFEVMARTGKKGSGKYAILHAYALSAFGGSKSKIRKTSAYYGFFWNKIDMRWKSKSTHNYALQMRTNCNYGTDNGKDIFIDYKVTRLWDDEKFLHSDHFY